MYARGCRCSPILELGKGSWAMRKQSLELRHIRAIVMLAEESSYTRPRVSWASVSLP